MTHIGGSRLLFRVADFKDFVMLQSYITYLLTSMGGAWREGFPPLYFKMNENVLTSLVFYTFYLAKQFMKQNSFLNLEFVHSLLFYLYGF